MARRGYNSPTVRNRYSVEDYEEDYYEDEYYDDPRYSRQHRNRRRPHDGDYDDRYMDRNGRPLPRRVQQRVYGRKSRPGGLGTKLRILAGNISGYFSDMDDFQYSERPLPREYYGEAQYYPRGENMPSPYKDSESRRAYANHRKDKRKTRSQEIIDTAIETVVTKGKDVAKEVAKSTAKKATNSLMDKMNSKQSKILEDRKVKSTKKLEELQARALKQSTEQSDEIEQNKASKLKSVKKHLDDKALERAEAKAKKYQEAEEVGSIKALKSVVGRVQEFASGSDELDIDFGDDDNNSPTGLTVLDINQQEEIALQEMKTYQLTTDRAICIDLENLTVTSDAIDRGLITKNKRFKENQKAIVGQIIAYIPATQEERQPDGTKVPVKKLKAFWHDDNQGAVYGRIEYRLDSDNILLNSNYMVAKCKKLYIHGSKNSTISIQFTIKQKSEDSDNFEDYEILPDEGDEY